MISEEGLTEFLSLVQDKARQRGCRFYLNVPEGRFMHWPEREIELCDVSGWMVPENECAEFEPFYYGYFENDLILHEEFKQKYLTRLQMVEWKIEANGQLDFAIFPRP